VAVFVNLFRATEQVKRQAEAQIALAREQEARAAAEELMRRSAFLAEASVVLSKTLYSDRSLLALTRHIVPFLADACFLRLIDDEGRPHERQVSWINASGLMQSFSTNGAPILPHILREPLRQVINSEIPEWLGSREVLSRGASQAAPPRDTPIDFTPTSAIIVPLRARGGLAGVMTVAVGHGEREFHQDDVLFCKTLADRAATALENARLYHNIQESDRRKNEFLAMLAHELRNPLAPIRSAVDILHHHVAMSPELEWVHDVLDRQVQQMVRLVDDLLDMSRATRGSIVLKREPVDLSEVVARAIEMSRPSIDARGHRLEVNLPAASVYVDGDLIRLTQVLGNLLNNAAKFTEPGGQIWLTLERGGQEATIHVRDNGIGIPTEMLPLVFELFTQVNNSLDRSYGGMGIGLTLVRHLVELHGGRVDARSEGPGQGSEFVVRLPILVGHMAPPSVPDDASNGGDSADDAHRILLVDDNADAALSLAMLLRCFGHEVESYHEGAAALEAAEELRPEVALIDISMPGMDGYQVARRLRLLPGLQGIVLIALTGYGREEDRRQSYAAGFDHHLVKPVKLDELTQLLASLKSDQEAKAGAAE